MRSRGGRAVRPPVWHPGRLIAAAIYAAIIVLALPSHEALWARYSIRTLGILAVTANVLGLFDMHRFGAWCFYCLLTTALAPVLLWMAFLL